MGDRADAQRRVYLDNAATTRISNAAFAAMEPYLRGGFGNPSSLYAEARMARAAVEQARAGIAALIGADPHEVYFTSCGTESDNWAIKGCMHAQARTKGRKGRFVTTAFEHPAVLNSARTLHEDGFDVAYVPVGETGFVDERAFAEALGHGADLASAMLANNEVGTIQPVARLARAAHAAGARFHCDAVQAFGHIPVDVRDLDVDYLSVSGHKFHGPKGVGFLYARDGAPLEPLMDGGRQERGLRGGTENVAGIVGMAAAAEEACTNMAEDARRIARLRNELQRRILEEISGTCINGAEPRVPGTLDISFEGVDSASLVELLDERGVCASGGSACASREGEPSHVLTALGLSTERAQGALRFSLSDETSKTDIDQTLRILKSCIDQLRNFDLIDIARFRS